MASGGLAPRGEQVGCHTLGPHHAPLITLHFAVHITLHTGRLPERGTPLGASGLARLFVAVGWLVHWFWRLLYFGHLHTARLRHCAGGIGPTLSLFIPVRSAPRASFHPVPSAGRGEGTMTSAPVPHGNRFHAPPWLNGRCSGIHL